MLDLMTKPASEAASEGPFIARPGALTEIAGGALDGAAVALALLSMGPGTVVWVQDRLSRLERGRPFPPGMARLLGAAPDMILIETRKPADALWAMEEALGCARVKAVVGEIHGAPKALSFTATKRLSLRAAVSGARAILIRSEASGLSVAERWTTASRPSPPHPDDPSAPGAPRWDLKLVRPKGRAPGHWMGSHDEGTPTRETHRLDLVSLLSPGAVVEHPPRDRLAAL